MTSSPFDLTGRTALVTGSSRGLGRGIARGMAEAGAHVVLHGRDPARLNQTADEFRQRFGEEAVDHIAFDVTDEVAVRDAIDALEDRHAGLDILVNNAGIQHREPLTDVTLTDWERVILHDLTSVFLVSRHAARGMLSRRRGKIVTIASIQADLARPTIGPYTAAKGGVRTLTRAMCAEWAGAGLQVNAVAPGYLVTEMTQDLVDDPEFSARIVARTPAARWGSPADVSGVVVWLSSSAADFVNGQTVFVDGGMSAVV